MPFTFAFQHVSTAFTHHSALFLLARTGFPPTSTHTGLVCTEGMIRTAIQLECFTGTSKLRLLVLPSAVMFLLATATPLTTISTGTSRDLPIRDRSRCQ